MTELSTTAVAQPTFQAQLLQSLADVTPTAAAVGARDVPTGLLQVWRLAASAQAQSAAVGRIQLTTAVAAFAGAAPPLLGGALLSLRLAVGATALAQAAGLVPASGQSSIPEASGLVLVLSCALDPAAQAVLAAGQSLIVQAVVSASALTAARPGSTLPADVALLTEAGWSLAVVTGSAFIVGPPAAAAGEPVPTRQRNWRVRRMNRTAA